MADARNVCVFHRRASDERYHGNAVLFNRARSITGNRPPPPRADGTCGYTNTDASRKPSTHDLTSERVSS